MNTPRVLIGVVTRNRADILRKAIASALDQQHPAIRVAVIDDGSTDATPLLPPSYPQVLWQRFEPGRGYMHARNSLMARDDYDYYVSLDDDAWFIERDEIAMAVAYLESTRTAGAVAFDILSPDRPASRARSAPVEVQSFIGCGHVLRRDLLRKTGLYENSPGSYGGEEKDLSLRIMDAGHRVDLLPGVHVWHDKTPHARISHYQHRSGVANDLAFALRRMPSSLVVAGLAVKIFRHVMFSARQRILRPGLLGVWDFIRASRRIARTRRPVRKATFAKFYYLGRAGGRRPTGE